MLALLSTPTISPSPLIQGQSSIGNGQQGKRGGKKPTCNEGRLYIGCSSITGPVSSGKRMWLAAL